MITTITLNTAIDHVLIVPEFRLGETIRSTRSNLSMGGKGTDVSYILGTLGIENLALGFKAGVFGDKMEAMLKERGVPAENIFISMERNMKCAIGLCGHCQFGPTFVCKDGPVFRYTEAERFFVIREV